MFELLNAGYLAAILFSSITMYPVGETAVPTQLDGIVEMQFVREWWRDDGNGKCAYTGMLVPFERTWPEEVERGGERSTMPPEPGKIVGFVALINRKTCKDTAPESMLRAGLVQPRTLLFSSRKPPIDKQNFFPAGDLLVTPADKIQPWLTQAVERLERLSAHNDAARAFIASSRSELAAVLPGRRAAPEATGQAPDIAGTAAGEQRQQD